MKEKPKRIALVKGKSDLAVVGQQVGVAMLVLIMVLHSGLEGNPSLFEVSTWKNMFYGFNSQYL